MPALEDKQLESFARARAEAMPLVEALRTAGYEEHAVPRSAAQRLLLKPGVRKRIAELQAEAAEATTYHKAQAVRDLITIIHAPASEASDDHPLCEVRMGRNGTYHRFPPKLQAMARLMKLMNWEAPEPVLARDRFVELLEAVRRRRGPELPPANESLSPSAPIAGAETVGECEEEEPDEDGAEDLNTAPASGLTPRQEAFALGRCRGLGVMEAYKAAGYPGGTANLAWRLHAMPKVKDRIRELNRNVERATGYRRQHAIRDLVAIIHARPSQASPAHELCEMRMTSWGEYHRFPSKLGAMVLLAKLLGWNDPRRQDDPPDPDAKFRMLAEFVKGRK